MSKSVPTQQSKTHTYICKIKTEDFFKFLILSCHYFQENGLWPATYAIEDVQNLPRGISALDRNHTHFLLVDDGTDGKYGTEIKFRTALESYISKVGTTGVSETQG